MSAHKGIYWLSSYPKSGNTWFRIFLANVLSSSEEPVCLNALGTGAIASSREWIDQALGFDSADLSMDELDALRPGVYAWHAKNHDAVGYHKIHDAYTRLENNQPMIPKEGCLGVLYLIRNPLDVAISFAHHSFCSIDEAIDNMGNKTFAFCRHRHKQPNQLRQWLLSWSLHVKSWIEATDMNVCVLRYEDMKQRPQETFMKAVRFLQLEVTESQVEKALRHAQIEKLQQVEAESGFHEKPPKVSCFFRKGIVGDWQTTLSAAQVQRIIRDHGEVMHAFGYLDEHNMPVCS